MGKFICQGVRITTSSLIPGGFQWTVESWKERLWRVGSPSVSLQSFLSWPRETWFPPKTRKTNFTNSFPGLKESGYLPEELCPLSLSPLPLELLPLLATEQPLLSRKLLQHNLSTSSDKQQNKILSLVTESTKLALFRNTVFLINPCWYASIREKWVQ